MTSVEELLIEYENECDIYKNAYHMMGKMLDINWVRSRIEEMELSNIYIYGGGFLGIQFYFAIKDFTRVIAIIDKSGKTKYEIGGISVKDLSSFKEEYRGENVVITPVQYYEDAYDELLGVVNPGNMFFLNEIIR